MPVGKLFVRAQLRKHRRAAGLAAVRTLAVDRHRRGDRDPLDSVRLARQHLQHDRCGHDVVARIVDDVGHALADAHRSGQMSQVGYALNAFFEHALVEKIAFGTSYFAHFMGDRAMGGPAGGDPFVMPGSISMDLMAVDVTDVPVSADATSG